MFVVLLSLALSEGGIDTSMFFSADGSSTRDNKLVTRSLARQHLANLQIPDDPDEWRQEVLYSLTNLAKIIDQSATRYEVEYEIRDELQRILAAIDQRGREMKKKFRTLESEATNMKGQIDQIVDKTSQDLSKYMKQVRKDVVNELREMVKGALGNQREDAEALKTTAENTIGAMNTSSSFIALVYFAGFQILLAVCLYLTWRYLNLAAI